eukprot:scaffold270338_cov34-Prasinocladus_malaysianus.AAC.1
MISGARMRASDAADYSGEICSFCLQRKVGPYEPIVNTDDHIAWLVGTLFMLSASASMAIQEENLNSPELQPDCVQAWNADEREQRLFNVYACACLAERVDKLETTIMTKLQSLGIGYDLSSVLQKSSTALFNIGAGRIGRRGQLLEHIIPSHERIT